jgi:hypothetical protein
MVVTCKDCGKSYDDTYRLTYCPHYRFEMCCTVGSGDKILGVATSVEELHQLLEQDKASKI